MHNKGIVLILKIILKDFKKNLTQRKQNEYTAIYLLSKIKAQETHIKTVSITFIS